MIEDRLMADHDRSDDWASLSNTRVDAIYNAYGDSIPRLYTSQCCCNRHAKQNISGTLYVKKMGNCRRNFSAIRYVAEWGNKAMSECKHQVVLGWQNRLLRCNHVPFPDSGRKPHAWDFYQVRPNIVSFAVSRHGIPGHVLSRV